MIDMIYFGKYLKDYLEYNNISQTEFATRIGITHNANSIKVKYLSNLPEINIGANLQIFL